MVFSGHGLHHFSLRNRFHLKHEPFPSRNKQIRLLDKVIYLVGVLGPVMTLPQIIKIFVLQNASGVSFITYFFLTIFSGVWLAYGIVHKEKPIIISNILWIVSELLIVIGTILYGHGFF